MSTQKEKGQLRTTNPTAPQCLDNYSCYRLALRGSKRESWGDAGVKGDTGLQAWGPYLRASLLASALLETLGLRSQGGYQCGKDGLPWPGWGKQ